MNTTDLANYYECDPQEAKNDSTDTEPVEAAQEVLLFLGQQGYI